MNVRIYCTSVLGGCFFLQERVQRWARQRGSAAIFSLTWVPVRRGGQRETGAAAGH